MKTTHTTPTRLFILCSLTLLMLSAVLFQATTAATTDVSLDVTVLLEGPYNAGIMSTKLNALGALPLHQPYDSNPEAVWYYTGTESVTSIPSPYIVDWVLVELRDAGSAATATPSTTIAQQAAFLLSNGTIVGLDGSSILVFPVAITNNLFVIVYHRNHLPVMSTGPVVETDGVYVYDFTLSAEYAYCATHAVKELAPAVWGMYAADVNGDGQVNNQDTFFWRQDAGRSGYYTCDINLDGQVNNPDKPGLEPYWNYGSGSQVPTVELPDEPGQGGISGTSPVVGEGTSPSQTSMSTSPLAGDVDGDGIPDDQDPDTPNTTIISVVRSHPLLAAGIFALASSVIGAIIILRKRL
ncbi:MAG: hypothetical protein JXA00_01225 [Candidatus Thermoplasmatota archaeon]|nr:hypothetical protein [Candidatus Thermoplasmatota archaeon]